MALVLGAGNQISVVMYDILHMLLVEDAVVICKMNPVNEFLGSFIRCAASSLGIQSPLALLATDSASSRSASACLSGHQLCMVISGAESSADTSSRPGEGPHFFIQICS